MQQLSMFDVPTKKIKLPEFNSDGYSIKGCSYIYAPPGQAGEYASLAANPYRGCGHKCVYCYVPQVIRISRSEFDNEVRPRSNFISLLTRDAKKYRKMGVSMQVMLSFTTDPYNPTDSELELTRQTIQVLRNYGLNFCILTKGGSRALRDIDLFRSNCDAFATTLTSLTDAVSLEWEPGAALPQDRLDTLKTFYDADIFTWVSLEPVYDIEETLELIKQSHKFVDLYKVGRINYHRLTKVINWEKFTHRVTDLLNSLDAKHYIKADLQSYLPPGYHNPKRVPQYKMEKK